MSLTLTQKTANVLSTVEAGHSNSAAANAERKRYIGWGRLRYPDMTKKNMKLPRSAVIYMEKKGRKVQRGDLSMPRSPTRMNIPGLKPA